MAKKLFTKGNKRQKKRDPDKLYERELLACKYLLAGANQAEALRQAGYSETTCTRRSHIIFGRDRVQKYLDEQRKARNKRLDIDADHVLVKLVEVVERCMQDVEPLTNRKGEQIRDDDGNPLFVFNAPAALKGLELVGKHVGVNAFKEVVENRNTNVDVSKQMSEDEARKAIDQLMGNVDTE